MGMRSRPAAGEATDAGTAVGGGPAGVVGLEAWVGVVGAAGAHAARSVAPLATRAMRRKSRRLRAERPSADAGVVVTGSLLLLEAEYTEPGSLEVAGPELIIGEASLPMTPDVPAVPIG
jgi:hypothetical protein